MTRDNKLIPKIAVFFLIAYGCGFLCMHAVGAPDYKKKQIKVFYEGDELRKKTYIFIDNGFPYIPVKDVAHIYRMTLDWKRMSQEIVMSIHSSAVVLQIGSAKVIINDIPRQMNREMIKINNKVCVPLELLLAQSFEDASRSISNWNNETFMLTVDKKVNVQPPHFYSDTDMTRIEIEYDPYVICKDYIKGNRITLSFDYGISGEDEKFFVDDGIVKNINMKQKNRKVIVDINLDASAGNARTSYTAYPHKVTIEVPGKGDKAPARPVRYDGTKKIIVIDPGHGGKDPGAIGRNGTKEKDLNLKLALKLEKILKNKGNFTVILTRDTDVFIPLLKRAQIANSNKADLFVSIHCNASLKKESEGFEIYFLSGQATDKAAEATARLENSALQLEADSMVKKKGVEKMLWSIAKNMFHVESADVCSSVLKQVQKRVKIKNRSAKQAQFYVLMNAQMPSVLIETGFVSNKDEEAKLKSGRFQSKIVDAYYAGIVDYFNNK
ncbi:MAG: N-acetylmuramoyl-L-alanine amidase [bacterium]